MSYVGSDSQGWGRGGSSPPQGFGAAEYGSGFDERARGGWSDRGDWGQRDWGERERGHERWRGNEQNRGASYRENQDRSSGRLHREHDGQGGHDRQRKSSWWQRESLTVADVMTSNVKAVAPDASVRDIAEIMKQEDVGVVPVVRADGRLVGLVTDRDLVVRGLTGGNSIENARAESLATTDIEVAAPRDPLSAIIDLMGRQQIRRVPVVDDDDRLVGIVAMADIANRADYHDDLQEALEKISGRRSFWSRIWR